MRRWSITLTILGILMFAACPNPVQENPGDIPPEEVPSNLQTVYVSTNGNNDNTGDTPEEPKLTIAEALLCVADVGDIKIAGGTYNETLSFGGSVNILGSYNEDFSTTDFSTHPTIIDGTGLSGSVFNGSDGNVELRELVLQNGTMDNGGGVNFNIGALNIIDCQIIDNTATEWGGAGVNVYETDLTITNSIINNNLAPRDTDSNGGGISAGSSTLILQNVDISYNVCNGNAGGGVFLSESTASFSGCTFTGNSGTSYGGGINAWNSILNLDSCTFNENYADTSGGGVSSGGNTGYETIITGCSFSNNSPDDISGDFTNGDITYEALTPNHGGVFDLVTLTGSGFGDSKPDNITMHMGPTVVRDDLLIHSWSDTEIVFYVPNVVSTGEYSVQLVPSGSGPDSSSDQYPVFTVDELYAQQTVTTTNVEPEAVEAGGQLTITGTGYTPVPGMITVSGYECEIVGWAETEISFLTPTELQPRVHYHGGDITTPFGIHGGSAGPSFQITPETPAVTSNLYTDVQIQGDDIYEASQYELLRADNQSGPYTVVDNPSDYNFHDTSADSDTTYYYAYRGLDASGSYSSPESLPLEVTTSTNTEMYTVSFNSQGGSPVSSQEVGYGSFVSEPSVPARTGYTFDGWYKESACSNPWNFAVDTVTTDTELFAKWTINQYTVNFESDGGSSVAAQTIDYGALVSEPTHPTKSGYEFDGWHADPDCSVDWDFDTDTVTGTKTLYAAWLPVYTVTFNSQGGSAVDPQPVVSGGLVTEPTDPTRSGYTFDSWYEESSCINGWNFSADTVTGDKILYAGWTENQPALAVENIIVRGSDSVLHVYWTEPTDPARDHVALRYRESGGSWQSVSSVTSPYEITGLANGTLYEIELISVNIQGDETAASTVEGTPTNRLYVDTDAASGNSGLSWIEAINSLEIALDISTSGMEIWVAEGVYTPPIGSNYIWPDGVAIYGGFNGSETSLSQADWETNRTYLETDSGTIISGSGLSSLSILQGFILQGASVHALSLSNSSAIIRKTIFTGNTGTSGAAVYINGGAPQFIKCDFIDNSTSGSAGAVSNNNTLAEFYSCRFLGNSSLQGGALYNTDTSSNYSEADVDCRPVFVNCMFTGNSSGNYGGAMYNADAIVGIYNCTFTGNNAGIKGDAVFILNNISYPISYNSIYWNNDGVHGLGCQYVDIYGDYRSCVIQSSGTTVNGTDLISSDPRLADPDGEDDIYGTIDDEIQLLNDSPVIDAGNISLLPEDSADLDNDGNVVEAVPLDMDGLSRTFGGGLNIGAVESTCIPPPMPVSDLSAEYIGSGTIKLTWIDPADPNLDHVEVWFKEFDNAEYVLFTENGTAGGTDVSGLTPAIRYNFMILGINSEGRASDPQTVQLNAMYIDHYTHENSGLAQYNGVGEIETDSSGTLFLTNSSLVEWDGNTNWKTWDDTNGFTQSNYGGLEYVDGQGLYVGTLSAVYLKDTSDVWTSWTTADGLPSAIVESITDTVLDTTSVWNLFAATSSGIAVYDGSTWSLMTLSNTPEMLSDNVEVVEEHPSFGWILAGFAFSSGGTAGLGIYDGTSWENHTTIDGEATGVVNDIAVGPSAAIYIARSGDGVSYYNGSSWTTYNTGNSELAWDYVNTIAVDPTDGTIYAGTMGYGISIYDGTDWITLTTADGLLDDYIKDIYLNADGSFYVATSGGLSLLRFDN